MTNVDAATLEAIKDRHPDAMKTSVWKRYRPLFAILACVFYTMYCWWFFSVSEEFKRANWTIAGSYLADWISWEARPDFDIDEDGALELGWPRFSPLGETPEVDWITTEKSIITRTVEVEQEASAAEIVQDKVANSFMVPTAKGTLDGAAQAEGAEKPKADAGFSFMAPNAPGDNSKVSDASEGAVETKRIQEEATTSAVIEINGSDKIEVFGDQIVATRDGDVLTLNIDVAGQTVFPVGELPEWATQKREGGKVTAWFGFAGRAELDYDSVKVRKRFLGWENFVFDTRSPYWGMSAGEVIGHLFSSERLDESRSNLSLAWDNILYNGEWQHLDVWTKLLQTIVMAFVGTLFACIVAFPLAFFAARNITPSWVSNQFFKRFFDFLRSVDMLIWALFFTRAFGPGPLAGISAIFFTDTGTLGKLYSEALENIDDKQREGVRSVGARPTEVQRYGVLPQVMPVFASQALYFWESNTRSATIIGAVGAGGIGLKLWEAMRTNQDWENVAYMVILILIVVFVFDNISNALRSKLMGK